MHRCVKRVLPFFATRALLAAVCNTMESAMEGIAIQSGESAELGRMTSDEAQAVIDLWAQRQRQFEDEASKPSSAELAEALNIPNEQIWALLHEVRTISGEKVSETVETRNSFKSRLKSSFRSWKVVLVTAILASIITYSVIDMTYGVSEGSRAIRVIPRITGTSPAPYEGPTPYVRASDVALPELVGVEFDSMSLVPDFTFSLDGVDANQLRMYLEQAITKFVSAQKEPALLKKPTKSVPSSVMRTLANMQGAKGYFEFKELSIRFRDRTVATRIPICTSNSADVWKVVSEERSRLISSAARKAANLILTGSK